MRIDGYKLIPEGGYYYLCCSRSRMRTEMTQRRMNDVATALDDLKMESVVDG